MAFTFSTEIWVNFVDLVAHGDRFVWTLRITHITVDDFLLINNAITYCRVGYEYLHPCVSYALEVRILNQRLQEQG